MQVANLDGLISLLAVEFGDMQGAKVIRKRTLAKYLDAVNFPGGVNASADPTAFFPDDVYYVDQKESESVDYVQFALAAPFDVTGVQLPRRKIVQNTCPWLYRGAECGYTGTAYFDQDDNAVTSSSADECGKRLKSCKLRFGNNLPYGGFPSAGLIRT